MAHHPFRVFTERDTDTVNLEKMTDLFAPDIVCYSPFMRESVSGKEATRALLSKSFASLGLPLYTLELTNNQHTALFGNAVVNGEELQATFVITENAEGLISELRMYLRPYPVIALYWENRGKSAA